MKSVVIGTLPGIHPDAGVALLQVLPVHSRYSLNAPLDTTPGGEAEIRTLVPHFCDHHISNVHRLTTPAPLQTFQSPPGLLLTELDLFLTVRRVRDSNSRSPTRGPSGVQSRRIQPLCQLANLGAGPLPVLRRVAHASFAPPWLFGRIPTSATWFVQGSSVSPEWWGDGLATQSFATACNTVVEDIGIGPIASCLQSISVPQHIPLHQVCTLRPVRPPRGHTAFRIAVAAASHRCSAISLGAFTPP